MKSHRNLLTKFAVIAIVMVAFVDGLLVAQSLQSKSSNTSAAEAILLEDIFEPVQTPTLVEEPERSIPFISQAPLGDWKSPWSDYAEEAILLMLQKRGESLGSARSLSSELLSLDEQITQKFGANPILTAQQTLETITDILGLEATLTEELTESDLKAYLDQGNVLVLPVNGRTLESPHYTKPGPEHHMLLVTDYTEDGFLVQDPGTARGENFFFESKILLASIQDLDGGRVGIVIKL